MEIEVECMGSIFGLLQSLFSNGIIRPEIYEINLQNGCQILQISYGPECKSTAKPPSTELIDQATKPERQS